jgi:hypothetical protein
MFDAVAKCRHRRNGSIPMGRTRVVRARPNHMR